MLDRHASELEESAAAAAQGGDDFFYSWPTMATEGLDMTSRPSSLVASLASDPSPLSWQLQRSSAVWEGGPVWKHEPRHRQYPATSSWSLSPQPPRSILRVKSQQESLLPSYDALNLPRPFNQQRDNHATNSSGASSSSSSSLDWSSASTSAAPPSLVASAFSSASTSPYSSDEEKNVVDHAGSSNDDRIGGGRPVKSVAFDSLEFREYPIMLGDNPAVTLGPPVTIGWDALATIRYESVDHYEATRRPRRGSMYLRQSSAERQKRLRLEGIGSDEFARVDDEISAIQQSRLASSLDGSELSVLMAQSKRSNGRGQEKRAASPWWRKQQPQLEQTPRTFFRRLVGGNKATVTATT